MRTHVSEVVNRHWLCKYVCMTMFWVSFLRVCSLDLILAGMLFLFACMMPHEHLEFVSSVWCLFVSSVDMHEFADIGVEVQEMLQRWQWSYLQTSLCYITQDEGRCASKGAGHFALATQNPYWVLQNTEWWRWPCKKHCQNVMLSSTAHTPW